MKTKSIILSGLLLAGLGAATTSCEDMFTTENSLVTTDLVPKDTVYQVMGIINRMQKLADRTVLLGELRADLVDINSYTSTTLQELANNNISSDNKYNQPADYYSVINSCNIYLAHVDSLLKTHGEYYYEKEIAAVKTFRAWTYLELAKIYGNVPLILDPITTANAAEEAVKSNTNRADLVTICSQFINDLRPIASQDKNNELRPSYGGELEDGSLKASYSKFFIPVRLMLAELYLWRGSFTQNQEDFKEAVRFYHDFLTFPNEELRSDANAYSAWMSREFTSPMRFYDDNFSMTGRETVAFLPLDTAAYYGTYSDLGEIFSSQYKNDYYVSVNPSARIKEISQAQSNCYEYVTNTGTNTRDTVYAPTDPKLYSNELYMGDLRLASIYATMNVNDEYHSELSSERQYIAKFYHGTVTSFSTPDDLRIRYLPFFRVGIVYLHMAEALNRAGFPETAFAVLKYGLSEKVLADRNIISQDEYDRLAEIQSIGFAGDFTKWDDNVFKTRWEDPDYLNTNTTVTLSTTLTIGIHARGSGSVEANKYYYLPTDSSGIQPLPELTATSTPEDSAAYKAVADANAAWLATPEVRAKRQEALQKMILEEEALEGVFEGHRFYDLMRYAKYNATPAFLAERVAERKGKENVDTNLLGRLSNEQNWYLQLPKK